MKIAKLIFMTFVITALFQSCLGDSNNTMGYTNQFGYVQSGASGLYAGTVAGLLVTGNGLNGCSAGDFVTLTFSMDPSQKPNADGAYKSDDLVATKIPGTKYMKSQGVIASAPVNENTLPVNDFQIGSYNPYQDFLQDNWTYNISYNKKDGQVMQAYFYYDANNQLDKSGNQLDKNQVILDVRFMKTAEGVGTATLESELLISSMNALRSLYRPTYITTNSAQYTTVLIQFRYKRLVGTEIKDETVGSLSFGSANTYGMYYKNP